jgi:Ca-activated chloride channel family protein
MPALLTPLTDLDPRTTDAGIGTLRTATGNLPLFALDVSARVDGLSVQMEVSQSFRNAHATPIEAVYLFPLPDRLAVRAFTLQVGERVIVGQLHERGAARATYAEAKQAGQQAALAEEERPGVFTVSVGNLPPHSTAIVRLTLVGTLPCTTNEVTLRFPLVVAERYQPGRAVPGPNVGVGTAADTDAVPDASRISPPIRLPGCPDPVRLSLRVDLHPHAGMPITDVRSSLHSVLELSNDTGVRRILLQAGASLDRDFVLRYRLGGTTLHASATLCPQEEQPTQGVAELLLVPPQTLPTASQPRDMVVLLDRSGSMDGWKMLTARRAVAEMLQTFTPADRVALIAFESTPHSPTSLPATRLHAATDAHRWVWQQYLDTMSAHGGTEMAEPLQMATHLLSAADPARERILLLLTDGQVGNEDQLLHALRDQVAHLRIHTLGIDRAVNEGFLRRLAEWGRGSYTLVESASRLDAALAELQRHIGTPVLTNVQVTGTGIDLHLPEQVPVRTPDLFAGAHWALWVPYRAATANPVITLTGTLADGSAWSTHLPVQTTSSPAPAAAWARSRVRTLEDAYALGNDRDALERQIVATSLRHRVLCRFTAFVAVDRDTVVNPGGVAPTIVQPVAPTQSAPVRTGGYTGRLQQGLSRLSSIGPSTHSYGFDAVRPSSPRRALHTPVAKPTPPTVLLVAPPEQLPLKLTINQVLPTTQ